MKTIYPCALQRKFNAVRKGWVSMVNDKKLGEYCSFLNKYVPVRIKYSSDDLAVKSCDNTSCGNAGCNLCDAFAGDKSKGKDCLNPDLNRKYGRS